MQKILEEVLPSLLSSIEEIMPYLIIIWQIVIAWWWLILPLFLFEKVKYFWLWWRNQLWEKKHKYIILEIRMPKENIKPTRAMELVFTGLWQIWAPPNWIEKWWDGEDVLSYSFEIAAIDGVPHFLIRCHKSARGLIETHIYSQFPEAEIFQVEDYTKKVPQDLPNKDWFFWGTDYKFTRKDYYPIKTYHDFESERETKEEKRIDPMNSLMEAMGSLKKGEQIWVQFRAKPFLTERSWIGDGKKAVDSLVKRKEKTKNKSFLGEFFDLLIGSEPKKKEEEKLLPPEMMLTFGEKEVVSGIEKKISKLAFEVGIRYLYLAKKEVAVKPNLKLPMSYFTNFGTNNLNSLIPDGKTIPKVRKKWYDPFWFPKRRLYIKKRRLFRKYITRLPYNYPMPGGAFVLNTEEMATIYHFPSKILTPSSQLPRVESKKGGAPLELPIED